MIILIRGPERSFKDGLGAILATEPEFDYPIKQGFGNLHLFKTPYPWHYMPSRELLRYMSNAIKRGDKNVLYYLSEGDKWVPSRSYKDKEQLESLTGLWQGEKSENVFICNYHPGDPEEPMTGVDLILRSSASIKIDILKFNRNTETVKYRIRNVMLLKKARTKTLKNVSRFYSYWDHKEQIV